MYYITVKDKKFRLSFLKQELRLIKFRYLLKMRIKQLRPIMKFQFYCKFYNVNLAYMSKIKNRCVLTARGRAPIRQTKMSRLAVRALAINGYLCGFVKFCF